MAGSGRSGFPAAPPAVAASRLPEPQRSAALEAGGKSLAAATVDFAAGRE